MKPVLSTEEVVRLEDIIEREGTWKRPNSWSWRANLLPTRF